MIQRHVEVVVISDVHLGTYGCHAKELCSYLKSIQPSILILNGDIIDGWAFSRRYFPSDHIRVLQRILKMMGNGTCVYYVTGNHDEMLRRFSRFKLGNFILDDKMIMMLDGKLHWFFHGDVFDVTMKNSKWIAKLGGKGYNLLILLNRAVNYFLEKTGKEKISLSKKVKNNVKQAVSFISNFEETATDIAIEKGYDFVVCGHIHQPTIKQFSNGKRQVTYLNSGDWIENLSVLEYHDEEWKLQYFKDLMTHEEESDPESDENINGIPDIYALYEDIVRHPGNGQWPLKPRRGDFATPPKSR
ncbi:MAG: UDP-2,3-diacylglucosamine diphosphatase [Chitinophagales bacterium]|jgi:UDP-2,3-diacylglucosamine pyrophosphatase LpxH|nr:UDP-2,3-diacylglucosamine diphosphatase [Chitinophagales bacterium]